MRPLSTSSLLRNAQRISPRFASPRRLHTSGAEAAEQLLAQFSGTVTTRRQVLDGNQLQKLSLTLNRKNLHPGLNVSHDEPPKGTPLPPGYHLVYFTPNGEEVDLGLDGTDRTFNAPPPFTRRMWAGGRMRWFKGNELRVGETVEEQTRLVSAEMKKSRDGSEMVLVSVEKAFHGERGLALVDQRSWVFRNELPEPAVDTEVPVPVVIPRSRMEDVHRSESATPERHVQWSPISLFRFSALTFNAHRIHYDAAWSQGVEAHKGLVVHGPINLIGMLDYWRDVHGQGAAGPAEISYRALSPLYAGQQYCITSEPVGDGGQRHEMRVKRGDVVCMRGEITRG